MSDELRDQLPADLNMVDYVGAYMFPDNSRRRIQVGFTVSSQLCCSQLGWPLRMQRCC